MKDLITMVKVYIWFFVILFVLCFLQGVVFRKAPTEEKAPVEIEQTEIKASEPIVQPPVTQDSTVEDLKILAGGYTCYSGRVESRHIYEDGMMIYSYKGKIFYAKILKLSLLQGTMTAQQVASTTGDEWVFDKKAVIQADIFIDPVRLDSRDSYIEPYGSVKDPVHCEKAKDSLDQYRQSLSAQLH